jgi:DUF1009 family protein
MNEQIKHTALYQIVKDTIINEVKTNSDNLVDSLMNIFEPFITDKLKQHELFRNAVQANSTTTIIVPDWTEEDDVMVDSIISDTLQHADLDNEQISWLKNLKSNFHNIQNKILNNG